MFAAPALKTLAHDTMSVGVRSRRMSHVVRAQASQFACKSIASLVAMVAVTWSRAP